MINTDFDQRAAVAHDRYCQTRERPWREVYLMFYEAIIADKVDTLTAKTMYAAVYAFGPRWSMIGGTRAIERSERSEAEQQSLTVELQRWIKETNPSPEEIGARIREMKVR